MNAFAIYPIKSVRLIDVICFLVFFTQGGWYDANNDIRQESTILFQSVQIYRTREFKL